MNGFCTIVSEDFIPAAFALAESITKLSPDAKLSILVLKESFGNCNIPKELSGHICFHSLADILDTPLAIDIIRRHWNSMDAIRWTLKPVYMSFLLNRYLDKVLYVDPDIMFVGDFTFLFDDLDKYGIFLTPHWRGSSSQEDTENFPKQFTDGIFNAGFVGASLSGLPALEWWTRLCLDHCEKNPLIGLYDDQRYLDIMPVYFDNVGIVRHRGCNIAAWNRKACARSLNEHGNLLINGTWSAVFIHFSCMGDIPLQECDPHIIPFAKAYREALSRYGFQGSVIPISKHDKFRKLLQETLSSLKKKGCESAALYGCGAFTRGLFSETFEIEIPIACIADDTSSIQGGALAGIPIVSLEKALIGRPDALIVSSDSIAKILIDKASRIYDKEKILNLCEPNFNEANTIEHLTTDNPIFYRKNGRLEILGNEYKTMPNRKVLNLYLHEVTDPSEFRDRIRLVLVHQMGKVGSSTIYNSIKKLLPNVKIHHTHFLSDSFTTQCPSGEGAIPVLYQWWQSVKEGRKKILADISFAPPMTTCVVTGFRHLNDYIFSSFFQTVPFFFPHLSYRPELIEEELGMVENWWLKILWLFRNTSAERFEELILMRPLFSSHLWFEEEYRKVFGIDAYTLPITNRDLYAFTDGTRLYVLYRYEKFLENFDKILSYVMAPQDIQRIDSNVSDDKPYGVLYREFRKRVTLPPDIDHFLRHTPYAQHFYGEPITQEVCGEIMACPRSRGAFLNLPVSLNSLVNQNVRQ